MDAAVDQTHGPTDEELCLPCPGTCDHELRSGGGVQRLIPLIGADPPLGVHIDDDRDPSGSDRHGRQRPLRHQPGLETSVSQVGEGVEEGIR